MGEVSEAEKVRRLFVVAGDKLPGFVAPAMRPVLKQVGEEVAQVVDRLDARIKELEQCQSQ